MLFFEYPVFVLYFCINHHLLRMHIRSLFISVILFISSFFFSSATHWYESPTISPEVVNLAGTLSCRLGLSVTDGDNLNLYEYVSQWIGAPYRRAGLTKKGVDCSGFVTNVFRSIYDKKIERSSANIFRTNCEKVGKQDLHEGDLVFFCTRGTNSQTPSHVGVYLKDGKFVHSSISNGVIISSLSEPYYAKRWISGGRVK